MTGTPLPVQPTDAVVLAVGVIVAPLGASQFVAGQNHRHPSRQQQEGREIADLPVPQRLDPGIRHRPFMTAVPAQVVRIPVTILFAIGQVMFFLVTDQVGQGEAVVAGDEIDAMTGFTIALEQIRTPR